MNIGFHGISVKHDNSFVCFCILQPVKSKDVMPMEMLPINNDSGQSYGFILYTTILPKDAKTLTIYDAHDYVTVRFVKEFFFFLSFHYSLYEMNSIAFENLPSLRIFTAVKVAEQRFMIYVHPCSLVFEKRFPGLCKRANLYSQSQLRDYINQKILLHKRI